MRAASLEEVEKGGKLALARAFAAIEQAPFDAATLALLDEAYRAGQGAVVGITDPPGVGKSTLLSVVIKELRGKERSVGVIVVDPSSRRSGGALLGDRTRIETDPEDDGVFVRSMAARDRLGGLAELCAAGITLLRAMFDMVIVETVGVGQSETAIRDLSDSVVLAIQPGSGDALQFMKAGILEIPDIAVVTKADIRELADKTALDLEGALHLTHASGTGWQPPVLRVSAPTGEGIDALLQALDAHAAWLAQTGQLQASREARARRWLEQAILEEHGRRGLALVREELAASPLGSRSPFLVLGQLLTTLSLVRTPS